MPSIMRSLKILLTFYFSFGSFSLASCRAWIDDLKSSKLEIKMQNSQFDDKIVLKTILIYIHIIKKKVRQITEAEKSIFMS